MVILVSQWPSGLLAGVTHPPIGTYLLLHLVHMRPLSGPRQINFHKLQLRLCVNLVVLCCALKDKFIGQVVLYRTSSAKGI